ncbi:YqcI/YcgG family protein [Sphingopyxis sp. PAMC25046]|uniref:guanitoxin biosynthesis heme-dependent pre-guanitoxin N-hydroxylase GntA n=1 Tax=Sphingopyxis sp. PAMC25046 TaxID=2565556 RepID=UPI00109DC9F3|nr:guanitoxin biosynthesis heme-dependent pre-guanitoxin N-hydroxylase GntA [Sphingopyxis sp. PAMC25046]QCB55742.1 YqcI/YcgG family protein [Sphingopyxis sp. PAMC25046]
MLPVTNETDHPLAERFADFLRSEEFPCVGAKSALARDQVHFVVGRDIRSAWDDLRIYPNLLDLASSYARRPSLFHSLVVLFEEDSGLDEKAFEACLWDRLASLSHKDDWHGQPPDPRVSSDPRDPHFSLSFGGEAFFVVGLHPRASRPARRFERPALVFNLHDQFETLRASGLYEKMRTTIIARDVALAGDVNPMLARHGSLSEARQYSGREVGSEWRCPFAGRNAGRRRRLLGGRGA